ncbi:MAG: rRNA maturation RNase YbeY [Deltaproteobacteria bacterium]|nr:rRNA maturation RNase YbeY [Deltaproteobacteria bacterium]
MEIQITLRHSVKKVDPEKIRTRVTKILEDLGYHNKELSILFTNDEHIAELNRLFLKRDGPTNVLAFPMGGGPESGPQTPMIGDIVISLDAAERDAEETGEDLDRTINRLLIHGFLHLLGYDHERSEADARKMERETERLLHLVEC